MMKVKQAPKRIERAVSLTLGLLLGCTAIGTTANAQPAGQARVSHTAGVNNSWYQPDELLLMPAANVKDQELDEILGAANCRVAGVMGKGVYRVIVLKTVRGKLAETEQKLRKDKHIGLIQRNYTAHLDAISPDDPIFKNGGDGFLTQLNVPKAWNLGALGDGQTIGIIDTGCQASTGDLANKTDKGYDGTSFDAQAALVASPIAMAAGIPNAGPAGLFAAIAADLVSDAVNPGARVDNDPDMNRRGHGTECATVAAGAINGVHGVGVAPKARIYPIHDGDNGLQDMALLAGLYHLMTTPGTPKIISISAGGSEGVPDPEKRPIDHFFFRAFHAFGGIIFLSAGNDKKQIGSGQMGYANVVSAVDGNNHFDSSYSNYGSCITFAAPGTVNSVTKYDEDRPMSGTSYSTPACAGIAALIWAAKPSLTNVQVESIMKQTAFTPAGVSPNFSQYGYGIPDAEAAVKMAAGM